jgi:serine/threonine protein kinase
MLERLSGVAGVARLAEAPRYSESVVLEDAGGARLAGLPKPLPADRLAGLGLGLARAVAGMHGRGVIHRDITPANVVVGDDGTPCLVDFALALSFAEIRPEFTHHAEITGTLAYLAPEATGRTGRPVDQRADLYALGATLYELATGAPPFGLGDPLRLVHDHLARVPVPPAEANRAVPAPLSEVITHLLEKEPDNRYQTADGLVYDLERWQDTWTRPPAGALRVGEHDVPVRLLPPSRLVGRGDEVAALETAFADALASRSCTVLLLAGVLIQSAASIATAPPRRRHEPTSPSTARASATARTGSWADPAWTRTTTGPPRRPPPTALDRADLDGFANYITVHSSYKVGVYSSASVWASIFGTGSDSQISNTYEWTYEPETTLYSSASRYALMWQWSGGGGVTNGIGGFNGDLDTIDGARLP